MNPFPPFNMMDHVPTWLSYFLLACHLWMAREAACRMVKAALKLTAKVVVAIAKRLYRARKRWLAGQSKVTRPRPSALPDPLFDGLVAGTAVVMCGIYLAT